MALSSPSFVVYKLVERASGKQYCSTQLNEAFGVFSSYVNYILATFILFYYIPIALLVILYSIIVIKLKKQKIPGEQSDNAEQKRAKRNRNVLKMSIAIVVGFALCFVAYSAIILVSFFAQDLPCGYSLYYYITAFMAYSNCAINPCICFSFSSNYRQGLKRLLKCFNTVQDQIN